MKKRKLIFIPFIAIIAVIGLFYFNIWTKEFFRTSESILDSIKDLKALEYNLESEIVKSNFFLYYNYDNIYKNVENIKEKLTFLLSIPHLKESPTHKNTYNYLKAYGSYMEQKEDNIIKFETLNSIIKNSTVYIPSLIFRYINTFDGERGNKEYLYQLTGVLSSLFLLRNSFDEDFFQTLKDTTQILETFSFDNDEKAQKFHTVLISHLKVYIETYPEYNRILEKLIMENEGKKLLKKADASFIAESKEETSLITIFAFSSTTFFLILLGYTAYLILSLDKKNYQLIKLANQLEKTLTTDEITGLPNRKAFNQDTVGIKNPTFILLNIDGFKNINDFYGTVAGDFILREFGKFLEEFLKEENFSEARVYRLGGDEFGILYENKRKETEILVRKLLKKLEDKVFRYKNLEITLNVSIGITFEPPLLEKADMVLKEVKNRREKYLIYSNKFDKSIEILENLNMLEMIKSALKEDRIVPVFQPIADNRTGEIDKFEVLARLITNDGKHIPPGKFLPVAKESKYYRDITKTIVRKAIETIYEKDVHLSINLSIEDILDKLVMDYLLNVIKEHPDIANKITIEILESESIHNYAEVQKFVDFIKGYGAKISIDDFGAGYSNFSHVVNLKPDFVKIDGSLIKNIHKDPYSKIIVSTIVDFSKKLNIKTVAEFVSSVEIYKVIRELEIDYSQGFFVGKPIEDIDEYKRIQTLRSNI